MANGALSEFALSEEQSTQSASGTLRSGARQVLSSFTLAYRASAVKSTIRTVGLLSIIGGNLALAGKVRAESRLVGTSFVQHQVLAGKLCNVERLRGSLGTRTALQGKIRGSDRLTGTVVQHTPLQGKVRTAERATGLLTFHSSNVQVAGTLRASSRTLLSSFTLAYRAAPTRTEQRATGVLSFAGGAHTSVAGRIRSSQARLSVSQINFAYRAQPARVTELLKGNLGIVTAPSAYGYASEAFATPRLIGALTVTGGNATLSGRIRSSGYTKATSITLVYRSAPARESSRLRSSGLSSSNRVALAGKIRSGGLLLSIIPSSLRYATESTAYPRLTGVLGTAFKYQGRVEVAPRLKGALTQRLPLGGKLHESARLRGSIGASFPGQTAVAGRVQIAQRLIGALQQKTSMGGRIRSAFRLPGSAFIRVVRLTGILRYSVLFVGTSLEVPESPIGPCRPIRAVTISAPSRMGGRDALRTSASSRTVRPDIRVVPDDLSRCRMGTDEVWYANGLIYADGSWTAGNGEA